MVQETKKRLLVAAGFLSMAVGFIGVFLPILPTAPFVLLAAICFSRGSERWHHWLITHPQMGPMVMDWEKHGVVRLKAKIVATVMVLSSLITMSVFFEMKAIIWSALGFTFSCVLGFIWTRPSTPREAGTGQSPSGRQGPSP